jgi:hypothetical protein
MTLPNFPQITLPAGLESIEGIEAVLYTVLLVLKEILPDKLDEIEAEWTDLAPITLPDPDNAAYAIVNDEDTYPDESDTFPNIMIMGFQDVPDETKVENPALDLYVYECAVRVWLKGDIASDVTKQVFRYGDAIKRVLKYVGDGTYDADGNQHITWTIRNISGRYSSVSPVLPYFQAAQIDFQVRVFREW